MHDVEEEVAIIAPIFTSCAADPKKKKEKSTTYIFLKESLHQ